MQKNLCRCKQRVSKQISDMQERLLVGNESTEESEVIKDLKEEVVSLRSDLKETEVQLSALRNKTTRK